MRIRILTPTRGDSTFMAEAFDSIARVAPDAEHIVISPRPDPGGLPAQPGGRRWVLDAGRGMYAALNRGLAEPGDWDAFTWINDDDRLEAGFRSAIDRLVGEPVAGVVYGRVALTNSAGRHLGELPIGTTPGDFATLLKRGIMPLAQPGTLIRRRVWDQVGALDETFRLAGDLDFFVRALTAGVPFAYCRDRVAGFRLRAGQLSKSEALNQAEFARAVAALGPLPTRGGMAALLRFRWANLGVYLERLRLHGGVTMQELYRRG